MQTHIENCIEFPNRIKLALLRLKKELALTAFEMAALLDISLDEYQKHERNNFSTLCISELDRLSDALAINVDDFINLKTDFKALAAQRIGCVKAIPKRYQTALFSSAQTMQNFITFANAYCGEELVFELLKSLQVRNINLLAPYDRVSIQLIEDIQHFLAKRIASEYWQEMFLKMGELNFHGYKKLGWGPKPTPSLAKAGCQLLEESLQRIDNTWDYMIVRATNKEFIFDITTKEHAKEELKTNIFGSLYSELQKEGFATAYLKSCGLHPTVHKTKSLVNNDLVTRFEICL